MAVISWLRKLYWLLLVLTLLSFVLVNKDVLLRPREFDLVFRKITMSPIWLVIVVIILFAIQILLDWLMLLAWRSRLSHANQKLTRAQTSFVAKNQRGQSESEEPSGVGDRDLAD